MIHLYHYDSSIGRLAIAESGHALIGVGLAQGVCATPADTIEGETALLAEAFRQLSEYLEGRRREFDLPLAPRGTLFQQRVWQALRAIPYGETRSYKEIAQAAGSPRGYRAAGMANNRNPLLIVVPCHRVIGADGSLVGFGGGLELKERLLRLEGAWPR